MPVTQHQIAHLLIVARHRMNYCKTIVNYPGTVGMKNFDTTSLVDAFYKNICNACFHDSLLLTATLLNTSKRTISFFNWTEFFPANSVWLHQIANTFKTSGLKEIRDQIVGHVDVANHNNIFPISRTQGIINTRFITELDSLQTALIDKFCEFTRSKGAPHRRRDFEALQAIEEISLVLNQTKPTMTNDVVIP